MAAARRDSRALIAAAARTEFAEHGYAGGRVDRIARRAGVNKQLIFYYFGSKAGLYRAVVEPVVGEPVAVEPARSASATEALRRAFSTLFDSYALRPDLTRLIILDAQSIRDEDRRSQRAIREFLSRIRTVIAEGQGHGYYRDDVDPDRTARQAVVLGLGYFALEPILDGPPDPGRAVEWKDSVIELLLRTLSW